MNRAATAPRLPYQQGGGIPPFGLIGDLNSDHAGVRDGKALYRRGRQLLAVVDPWPLTGRERFEGLVARFALADVESSSGNGSAALRAEARCQLARDATVFAGRTRMAELPFGNLLHRVLYGRFLVLLAAHERCRGSALEPDELPMLDVSQVRASVTDTANRLSCLLPGPGEREEGRNSHAPAGFLLAQLDGQVRFVDGLLRGRCAEDWQRLSRPASQKALGQLRSLVETGLG